MIQRSVRLGRGIALVDTTVLDAYFFLIRRLRPGAEIFSILFQVVGAGEMIWMNIQKAIENGGLMGFNGI